MLAVAVLGHSVANVREQVVASICAESGALKVSLKDLEDWVVFGALGAVHNAVEEGALVEAGRSQLICHHIRLHFRGENPWVNVTGAFIGTEHLLTGKEDLIQLVDHSSLKTASVIELFEQERLLDEDTHTERGADQEASHCQVSKLSMKRDKSQKKGDTTSQNERLTPNERHSFLVAAAVHPRVAVRNRVTPIMMHRYAACL